MNFFMTSTCFSYTSRLWLWLWDVIWGIRQQWNWMKKKEKKRNATKEKRDWKWNIKKKDMWLNKMQCYKIWRINRTKRCGMKPPQNFLKRHFYYNVEETFSVYMHFPFAFMLYS